MWQGNLIVVSNLIQKKNNSNFLGVNFNNWVIDTSLVPIFIFVFIFPAAYAELNRNFTPDIFILWVIEKFIVWMTCYAFWRWMRRLLIGKSIRKINFLQIIMIGFLGGLLTTLIGATLINLLKLPNNISQPVRFGSTIIISISVILCTSILGRKRGEYALRRRGFRKSAIQSSFLQLKSNKAVHLEIKKYESALKIDLLVKLKPIDRILTIYDLMEIVREYSHLLSRNEDLKRRQTRFEEYKLTIAQEFKFISYSFKTQALIPSVYATVIALIFGIPLIRHSINPVAFIITGIYFCITYSFHYIHRKLMQDRVQSISIPVLVNLSNLILIVFVDSCFVLFFPELFEETIFSIRLLFVFMTYSFFCLAGHLAQGSSKLEEHLLLSELVTNNQTIYAELVKGEIKATIDVKWSNFLHNEIQSSFLALALSEKKRVVKSELDSTFLKIETKTFIHEVSRYSRSDQISKNFAHLTTLWKNIISISYKLDDRINNKNLDPSIFVEILEIANELISNAVRHGGATKIDFNIESRSNYRYYISASNNGLPYQATKSGLGSVLLNEVAPSNWSIRNSGNLVKVEIVLIGNN